MARSQEDMTVKAERAEELGSHIGACAVCSLLQPGGVRKQREQAGGEVGLQPSEGLLFLLFQLCLPEQP